MDIEAYRNSGHEFMSELTREYYRHFAGLQDEYETGPIYDRHSELFTRSAVDSLRVRAGQAPAGSEERRRLTILVDFAVDGYVGQATKEAEATLALAEVKTMLEPDGGERVGFRESSVLQANEPDPERRAALESARMAAIRDTLGELYRALIEGQHASASELGWASYREMCSECKRIDLGELGEQCAAFTAATEEIYTGALDRALRHTIGLGLAEARRSDLPRFFRAPDQDAQFPGDRLLPCFEETLRGLGIDLHTQPGVVLDVDARPNKSPRAFCAPVDPPGEIYLVLTPIGGRDDFATLFHEGGHTEHFANVDPDLPFEYRWLGDNSITESFAFLLQGVVENGEWLNRRLGVADAGPLLAHARAERFVYLRRYAGKIAYELELRELGTVPPALADRYAELLTNAVGVCWPGETYLQDVDPGFYSACYVRAWALETHLRAHLQERFGTAWFERPEAGELLRGLWRDGQRLGADEMLGELTGERLDFGAVLADLQPS